MMKSQSMASSSPPPSTERTFGSNLPSAPYPTTGQGAHRQGIDDPGVGPAPMHCKKQQGWTTRRAPPRLTSRFEPVASKVASTSGFVGNAIERDSRPALITSISAVTLATHDMARSVQFYV